MRFSGGRFPGRVRSPQESGFHFLEGLLYCSRIRNEWGATLELFTVSSSSRYCRDLRIDRAVDRRIQPGRLCGLRCGRIYRCRTWFLAECSAQSARLVYHQDRTERFSRHLVDHRIGDLHSGCRASYTTLYQATVRESSRHRARRAVKQPARILPGRRSLFSLLPLHPDISRFSQHIAAAALCRAELCQAFCAAS